MFSFNNELFFEKLYDEFIKRFVKETKFGKLLEINKLSFSFIIKNPDVFIFVNSIGAIFGEEAKTKKPSLIIEMSGDIAHQFWLGQIDFPVALAIRQIKARGPVEKMLLLIPHIKYGSKIYKECCQKYGFPWSNE